MCKKMFQRLTAIGDICREANIETFGFTLDGNEHFDNAEKFIAYWDEISRCQELSEFFQHLLFVEQPIDRKNALSPDTAELFSKLAHQAASGHRRVRQRYQQRAHGTGLRL